MDPALIGVAVSGWVAFGFLARWVAGAIANGRWVPKETHEAIVSEKDRARDAADRRADLSAAQVEKLLVYARTADHILRHLPGIEGVHDDLPSPTED